MGLLMGLGFDLGLKVQYGLVRSHQRVKFEFFLNRLSTLNINYGVQLNHSLDFCKCTAIHQKIINFMFN